MALCLLYWRCEEVVKGDKPRNPQLGKILSWMLSWHVFLYMFSLCSCREQFHIYKAYSHSAIAFLTLLAPDAKRDQYIQYAVFHRLNFIFLLPRRVNVSFFIIWTPYLEVHCPEVGNRKSPQGQKKDQILRDNLENTITVIAQCSALNPSSVPFRSYRWLWDERC